MKYTINGYSQEALIKNGLDLTDSLILRTLSDMYLSNSKKIDYKILENEVEERESEREKKDNKDKFMWIKYSYLFEQIPIVGSERTIIRRIDKLIKKKILKKRVLNCRNGVKGTFLYVALNESYSDLTEYEDKMSSEGMPNWQGGYDKMSSEGMPNWQGGYDKMSSEGMPNWHDKDSSINDSSIKDSSYKEKYKKENVTEKLLNYIETLEIDSEKKKIFKEWVEYKKEKNQYKDTKSIDVLIKRFLKYSVQELRDIVEKSIMNNYSGIFEPKEGVNNGNSYNARYGRKQEDRHSKKPDYTKGFDDWN